MGRKAGFVLVVILATTALAQARIIVHFDRDAYLINPGETFDVQILLDMDDTVPGDQVPTYGLFSMGIRITFPSEAANVPNISAIVLPDEINSDGVGGPAFKEVGNGFARAAGAIDLSAGDFYRGALLATISISDLGVGPYPYEITLSPYYRTNQTNFVDGNGTDLDSLITFGSAEVVPEPVTMVLLGLGGLALLGRRRSA